MESNKFTGTQIWKDKKLHVKLSKNQPLYGVDHIKEDAEFFHYVFNTRNEYNISQRITRMKKFESMTKPPEKKYCPDGECIWLTGACDIQGSKCLTQYKCSKCGNTKYVDSSD